MLRHLHHSHVSAILEIDKDVPPELLYEVVEEIRDVAVVKGPKHLRAFPR